MFDSYLQYIKFAVNHIGDVILIYLKHVFNGLDMVYTNFYITELHFNRFWIQLLNYSLLFLGGIGAYAIIKKKQWKYEDLFIAIIWTMPILLVVPTAVEPRFFIGLSMPLYFFAVFKIMKTNFSDLKKVKIKTWLCYFSFVTLCFMLNKTTFEMRGISLW